MTEPELNMYDWEEIKHTLKIGEEESGWTGYSHGSGATHWHHTASLDCEMSAALIFPTPVDDDSGISHVLEHMVLRGSSRYPDPATFLKLRSSLTLIEFNATTQLESTRFQLSGYDILSSLTALDFLAVSCLSPLFNQTDFDQEIWFRAPDGITGALFRELEGYLAQPKFARSVALARDCRPPALLFGGMPDTLASLDIEKLRQYHLEHYRPEKMLLLTSGPWPLEDVWRLMTGALAEANCLANTGADPKAGPRSRGGAAKNDGLNNTGSTKAQSLEAVPGVQGVSPKAPHPEPVIELSFPACWAAVIETQLEKTEHREKLARIGFEPEPLTSDFQPAPKLRFRKTGHGADAVQLKSWVEGIAKDIPSRQLDWQWHCFCMQQARQMSMRWGDGLQRLYHSFSTIHAAAPPLKGDTTAPVYLSHEKKTPAIREWLAPTEPMKRLSVLCRFEAGDDQTKTKLESWLAGCQQSTNQKAWLDGKAILGSRDNWNSCGVLVAGYVVDLPADSADHILKFWRTEGVTAPEGVEGKLAATESGFVFTTPQSVLVKREGTVVATRKQSERSLRLTFTFPHSVAPAEIACLGQAVMLSEQVRQQRLSGQCYSVAVSLDLVHYTLQFSTVEDANPDSTFERILGAVGHLSCVPVTEEQMDNICAGGLGLVGALYLKYHGDYHEAVLKLFSQTVQTDFSTINAAAITQVANRAIEAMKFVLES